MDLFYEYFAQGIANSGIRQFGGQQCYNEIPPLYHWTVSITFGLVGIFITWYWRNLLGTKSSSSSRLEWNLIQKIAFLIGLLSFLFTFYFKVITKRGFFILNPCHITLLIMLILLSAKDNTTLKIRILYTGWTAWLFGPFGALAFPHLQDISMFEFVLYYVEHVIILPLGPLLLYRRYGNLLPTFKNQVASYGSVLIFQALVLTPLSRFYKVNLNFALCHSPYEPFFEGFGYHYYTIEAFNVCLVSYVIRMASYLIVEGCLRLYKFFVWIYNILTSRPKQKDQ